jgi:hypothetical protein
MVSRIRGPLSGMIDYLLKRCAIQILCKDVVSRENTKAG